MAATLLMLASGFAGLGYQIVWTQQASVWLGHETGAVLAVVAAFFGGMALGAALLGDRLARLANPAWGYAACELVIASWSVVLALALQPASRWLMALTGADAGPMRQWWIAWSGCTLLLLPATAAMGATLPSLLRVLPALPGRSTPLAGLYAANTAGALAGVLASAFWLVPAFGLLRTALLCAGLNLLCALTALRLPPTGRTSGAAPPAPRPASRALLLLAASGLLGIGLEVLLVRMLSQVAENTVFTFAMLLGAYLIGTAMGAAWLGPRSGETAAASVRATGRLLLALAVAVLAALASLRVAPPLVAATRGALGGGYAAALLGEAVAGLVAFVPASVLMGALFTRLAQHAQAAGVGTGRALAANTLGAALAPLLFGVVLLPALGAKACLLVMAVAYALLALSVTPPPRRREWPAWIALASIAGAAALVPPLLIVDRQEGDRLVRYEDGPSASVSVVEDLHGVRRLRIDNRQQEGSSATVFADARQALLPLLLHPHPQRVLMLGVGTGLTASAATADPDVEVDAVELLPEVLRATADFEGPWSDPGHRARLHLHAADARRWVRAGHLPYDLIVADNVHPARRGTAALYTVEHFVAVRGRLAADGIFCQWLPLHQMDQATLRAIVRAYVEVFPGAWATLATHSLETPVLGLVARRDGRRFDAGALQARLLASAAWREPPPSFQIHDLPALLGGFMAGPRLLKTFAEGAPANTDDHPVVATLAPRATYAPQERPRDRLFALLEAWRLQPEELLDAEPAMQARLSAYWSARDRFLAAGRDVRPSADARTMLAQVGEPLLAVLRTSAEFRPAYEPLLRLAVARARDDPADARRWLLQLAALQPARPEARQALQDLMPSPDGPRH